MQNTVSEIRPLTGIRAFAAWGVFFYHFYPGITTLFPSFHRLEWIVLQGDKGVDLFFILSGFVLAYNYAGQFRSVSASVHGYGKFLVMRLARLYPVHLFGLLVWALFVFANTRLHHIQLEASSGFFGPLNFCKNLLLIHAWGIPMVWSWNYPAWSISLEWFAYLQFPFLVLFLFRLRSMWLTISLIAALCLLAPIFSEQPYFHFIRIESEFSVGVLLCSLYRQRVGASWNWGAVSVVLSVIAVISVHWLGEFIFPIFAVLLYSLAMGGGYVSNMLASGAANYGGRISYSLYMMHAAVISACHVIAPPLRFTDSSFIIRLLVVLLYPLILFTVAALTYRYVEEPGRKMVRHIAIRAKSSAEALLA